MDISTILWIKLFTPAQPAQLGIHDLIAEYYKLWRTSNSSARNLQRYLIEAGYLWPGWWPAQPYKSQIVVHSKSWFYLWSDWDADGPFEFSTYRSLRWTCGNPLHDVLFSGDHILDDITPHQAPEHLTLSTGLEHYLHSLELLEPWESLFTWLWAGIKDRFWDLPARISAIQQAHNSDSSR